MTQSAIVGKVQSLLMKGITSEADASYLLVELRKLLEQQQAKKRYEYLTFHCDWAVHATLEGTTAQKILRLFDAASVHLKTGIELHQLPAMLQMEIDRISKMRYFERELGGFLNENNLPNMSTVRSDGWIHFVHFYAQIVEDCPLVITSKNKAATISSVTLKMELAKKVLHGESWFKVSWIVRDRAGMEGEIFVLNSFSHSARPRGELSG